MSEAKVSQVRTPRHRKPMSLAAKIRRATEQGMSARDIAKKYKADIAYVYQTQWEFRKKQQGATPAPTPASPPSTATVDFHFDASAQSFVPVMTLPEHVKNVDTLPQKNADEGGIVWLIDQKEAAPKPAAVEERKPTLWERFKFWAFGIRA